MRHSRKEALFRLYVMTGVEVVVFGALYLLIGYFIGLEQPGPLAKITFAVLILVNILYFAVHPLNEQSIEGRVAAFVRRRFNPAHKENVFSGLRDARSLAQQGNGAAAYEIYKRLAEACPENIKVLSEVGEFCEQRGWITQARGWYQKIIDLGIVLVPPGRMLEFQQKLNALEGREEKSAS